MAYKTPTAAMLGTLAAGVSIVTLGVAAAHTGMGIAVLEFPLEVQPGSVSLRYVGEPSQDEGTPLTFFVDVVDAVIGNSIVITVGGTATGSDYTVDIGADLPFTQAGTFSFPVTVLLAEDDTTEGDETLTVAITGYTGLTANGVQSYTINVNDTSLTPVAQPPVLNPPDPVPPAYITLFGGMSYSDGTTKSSSYTLVGGNTYRWKVPTGKGYRILSRTSSGSGTWVTLAEVPLTADPDVERNFDFVDTWHATGVSGNRYWRFEQLTPGNGGYWATAAVPVRLYPVATGAVADAPQTVVLSSAAPSTVNEGSDVAFTLTFTDANAGQQVDLSVVGDFGTVSWSSGTGYTTAGQRVTITADGSYVVTGSVSVPADNLTEGAENLALSLVSATNGLVSSGTKTVSINDTSTTPVATASISMARLDHGNTINEGTSMKTRFTLTNAPVGATWEVTADNSPLSEADFVNSLAVDAAANRPNGISVSVVSRTVKYEVTTAGTYSVDLIRPVKNDLTSEAATEQYNLKLQNVTGLTVSGGTLISNWVSDSSQSPPYVPGSGTTTANPITSGLTRFGVNEAGAEFGTAIYPRTTDMQWVKDNFTLRPVARIPFKMNRALANGSMLATSLNPTFVTEMTRVVNWNHTNGIVSMLDPHDYGRFGSVLAGSGDYNAVNVKRWGRMLGDLFVGKAVIWDMQNEPHDQNADLSWQMQVAFYQGIRESGHLGECIFAHTGWAGVGSALGETGAIAKFRQYTEGLVNVTLGLHSYPDSNSDGTTQDEALDIANGNTDIMVQRWTPVVTAAENAGVKLWVGEWGAGSDANSLSAEQKFRALINSKPAVFQGSTWWATGPWNSSYIRAVGPGRNNGQVQYIS